MKFVDYGSYQGQFGILGSWRVAVWACSIVLVVGECLSILSY